MAFFSRRKGQLIALFIGTSCCVILDDHCSVCLLSRRGKKVAWLICSSYCVILYNLFLCVFYSTEDRKAGCLVYWYLALCYFI